MAPFSWKKRARSFRYAWRGVARFVRTEHNAWLHLAAAAAAVGLGWAVGLSRLEWVAVAGCIGAVLAAEAINTAIERVVDLASPDFHPLAGEAKDIAAGAVLLCAATAAVVGCLIFVPKLLSAWPWWW